MGFLDSIRPVTVQAHQFDTVNQARPAVRNQVGLRLTPARERNCPLARTAKIEDFPARIQQPAVGVAHSKGVKLSRGQRDHDLVERGDALSAATKPDQRPRAEVLGAGAYIGVPKALANRLCLVQRAQRRLDVTREELLEGLHGKEQPPFSTIHSALGE